MHLDAPLLRCSDTGIWGERVHDKTPDIKVPLFLVYRFTYLLSTIKTKSAQRKVNDINQYILTRPFDVPATKILLSGKGAKSKAAMPSVPIFKFRLAGRGMSSLTSSHMFSR